MPDSATKPRIDAWDAALTDAQRWSVYDKLRTLPWYKVAQWASAEFGLASEPSRAAMYRFADRMRSQESARRIERALSARDEAGALVAARTDDAETIAAYKTLAQDLALDGHAEEAMLYTRMALDIAAQQTKAQEIALKAAAQETKDKALRLAREKFEAAEARATAAERRAEAAEAKTAELQARCEELERALQDAGKTSVADPAAVAAEVDRILGRKQA